MVARYMRGAGAGLLVALAMAGVTGCGGSDGNNEREQADAIREARADARREARAEAKADKAEADSKALQKQIDELKKGSGNSSSRKSAGSSGGSSSGGGSAAPASSGSTSCGGGLSVNSVTTCPFAENVRGEYGSNPGASEINAFSPATGKLITMRCSSGVTTICRGGNNAIVYIR